MNVLYEYISFLFIYLFWKRNQYIYLHVHIFDYNNIIQLILH